LRYISTYVKDALEEQMVILAQCDSGHFNYMYTLGFQKWSLLDALAHIVLQQWDTRDEKACDKSRMSL